MKDERFVEDSDKFESDAATVTPSVDSSIPFSEAERHVNHEVLEKSLREIPLTDISITAPDEKGALEYEASYSQDSLHVPATDEDVRISRQATQYKRREREIRVHSRERSCLFCIDYIMHISWIGKLFVAILAFLPPINYGKDLWVAYHVWVELDEPDVMAFGFTIAFWLASGRMLWMIITDLDSMKPKKFLLYIIPTCLCLDFKPDNKKNCLVYFTWEFILLIMAPFAPLYLLYLSCRKVASLVGYCEFDGSLTLALALCELIYETIPQTVIQIVLLYRLEVPSAVVFISLTICLLSLAKIGIVLFWYRTIIHKLIFKFHHNSVVKSVKFHPTLDLVASGSWDTTVLFHTVLQQDTIKAKRVVPCGRMLVNCIEFSTDGRYLAIGGHGLRVYDCESKSMCLKLPERIAGQKKRPRGPEITHVCFDKNAEYLYCAEGKDIVVYNVQSGEVEQRRKLIVGSGGCIDALAMSVDSRYIVAGTSPGSNFSIWKISGKGPQIASKSLLLNHTHGESVSCIEFTKGKYFVTGSRDGTLKLWEIRERKSVARANLQSGDIEDEIEIICRKEYMQESEVICVAVGAMEDDTAYENYGQEKKAEKTRQSSLCAPPISFGSNPAVTTKMGRPIIASGGYEISQTGTRSGVVYIHDLTSGDLLYKYENISSQVNSVDISPFGDYLAFGTDAGEYKVDIFSLEEAKASAYEQELDSHITPVLEQRIELNDP